MRYLTIPFEIAADPELSDGQRMVYGWMSAYVNDDMYLDKELIGVIAENTDKSQDTIYNALVELSKKGYIHKFGRGDYRFSFIEPEMLEKKSQEKEMVEKAKTKTDGEKGEILDYKKREFWRRANNFNLMRPLQKQFSHDQLVNFCAHWCAVNEGSIIMEWEKERTFSFPQRMNTIYRAKWWQALFENGTKKSDVPVYTKPKQHQ